MYSTKTLKAVSPFLNVDSDFRNHRSFGSCGVFDDEENGSGSGSGSENLIFKVPKRGTFFEKMEDHDVEDASSEGEDSLDVANEEQEVLDEIQSIIFSVPTRRPFGSGGISSGEVTVEKEKSLGEDNWSGLISPGYRSGVVTPRFSPKIVGGRCKSGEGMERPSNGFLQTSVEFRVFSHSPVPERNNQSLKVSMEMEMSGESSMEEERLVTPPLRTSNPIILNNNFVNGLTGMKKSKLVDIGLLSVSPSNEDMFEEGWSVLVKKDERSESNVYKPSKKDLGTLREVDELLLY